jgi:hypothetical protein
MLMGITLASIGSLLLMFGCSELTESAKEQNTMMMTDNTTVSKTDKTYTIPPIDAVAPVETETATFALG